MFGLVGMIVFFLLEVATYVSLRDAAEMTRQTRREQIEQSMKKTATPQQQEELARRWTEDIRQQARKAKPPVPQAGK